MALLLAAIQEHRHDDAKEHASDLLGWKRSGGFKPEATECPILIYPGLFSELHEIHEWVSEPR
jgi:hypothetical protein